MPKTKRVALECLLAVSVAGDVAQAAPPYWFKVREPVALRLVLESNAPCGRLDVDGCAMIETGTIILRRGLKGTHRACVFTHELRHLAGWDHEERRAFAIDCGDGELYSPQ